MAKETNLFLNRLQNIFHSKYPSLKIFAIYKISNAPGSYLVHASKSGSGSSEPNTYTVSLKTGAVKIFAPISNLRLYHKIHSPENLVWKR